MPVVLAASRAPSGFVAVTDGDGSLQISQFTVDGALVRHVTSGPANHNYPSVSPDGKRVVFAGGGGGYGDPRLREPELVEQDLLDGYVSEAAAREVYGYAPADGR